MTTALIHAWDTARYQLERCGGLIGTTELIERWGVNRARVHQLADEPDFPVPVFEQAGVRVWITAEVDHWKQQRKERFG